MLMTCLTNWEYKILVLFDLQQAHTNQPDNHFMPKR